MALVQVVDSHSTGTVAGTATVATLTTIGDREIDTMVTMSVRLAVETVALGVQATGTLTLAGNAGAAETVTIGAKTYTFVAALTNPAVANEVLIGASASDSLDNLIAAITGVAGAGSTYGTGTVAHTLVSAGPGVGDTMLVTALVGGSGGNAIVTTETMADGSWGDATLTGGDHPTLDVYLQRALAPSPTADDWQDFYHFPQITSTATDREIVIPLPHPQDVDGSLGSASRAVVQETLAADTLIAGHWGEMIRIREVLTGDTTAAGVYSVYVAGR